MKDFLTDEEMNELEAKGMVKTSDSSSFLSDAEMQTKQNIEKYRTEAQTSEEKYKSISSPFGQTVESFKAVPGAIAKTGKDIAIGVAKSAAQFGTSALASPIDIARSAFGKEPLSGTAKLPGLPAFKTIQSGFYNNFTKSKTTLEEVKSFVDTITQTAEGGASVLGIYNLLESSPKIVKSLTSNGKRFVNKIIDRINTRPDSKAIEIATRSLEPKLTLVNKEKIIRENILSGRPIEADTKEAMRLGEELKDVITTKDPIKALNSVGKNMAETESKLMPILESDRSPVNHNAFSAGVDMVKEYIPREFKLGSPETKAQFSDVFEFAKETAKLSRETTAGYREGRIAFDQAAKTQYPNAYKEGYIDVKTPAGKAIKLVRDFWNEYIYSSAESGSEIRELIKREADLFKAIDVLAPKAAALYGKNFLTRFVARHPMLTKIGIETTAVGGAAYVGSKIYQGLK